jgi:hypothetical protein
MEDRPAPHRVGRSTIVTRGILLLVPFVTGAVALEVGSLDLAGASGVP